ncbi:unnamed protein product [Orchesella dallaii]|uniref:Uncharacterized protein n=1 Tax=Orchesella dallaii TaxID=48710 RepID=A0ABP1PNY0_9HEXA
MFTHHRIITTCVVFLILVGGVHSGSTSLTSFWDELKNKDLFLFESSWSLFNTFKGCNLHFVWKEEGNDDILDRFMIFCIKNSATCIVLQEARYPQQINPVGKLPSATNATIQTMQKSDSCTVLLPTLKIPLVNDLQNSFPRLKSYHDEMKNFFRTQQGFIILPSLFKFSRGLFHIHVLVSTNMGSQIILLNKPNNGVYTVCMHCLARDEVLYQNIAYGASNYESKLLSPVVELKSPLSLKDLQERTKNWYRWSNSLGSLNEKQYKIISTRNSLPVSQNNLVYDIIFQRFNCTPQLCNSVFKTNYVRKKLESANFDRKVDGAQIKPIPFGIEFHGFRYAVFVADKNLNIQTDWLALLYPLSKESWICIGVAIAVTSLVLKITGLNSPLFWTISVVLEQGDNQLAHMNRKNLILASGWLFASVIFRNLYASTMYSFLAVEPTPSHIPTSFQDLVLGSDMKIVGIGPRNFIIKYLLSSYGHNKSENGGDFQSIYKSVYSRLRYFSGDRVKFNIMPLIRGLSLFQEVKCFASKENETNTIMQMGNSIVYKETFEKFAMIYNTMEEGWESWRNVHLIGFESLMTIFGKRKHFKNANKPVMYDAFLWYARGRYFFMESFQHVLASLVESGLSYHFENHHLISNRAKIFAYINTNGKFNKTWNFYTLSALLAAGADLVSTLQESDGIHGKKQVPASGLTSFYIVWVTYLVFIFISMIIMCVEYIHMTVLEIKHSSRVERSRSIVYVAPILW